MIIVCSLCDGEGEGEILKGVALEREVKQHSSIYNSTGPPLPQDTPKFRPPHSHFEFARDARNTCSAPRLSKSLYWFQLAQ